MLRGNCWLQNSIYSVKAFLKNVYMCKWRVEQTWPLGYWSESICSLALKCHWIKTWAVPWLFRSLLVDKKPLATWSRKTQSQFNMVIRLSGPWLIPTSFRAAAFPLAHPWRAAVRSLDSEKEFDPPFLPTKASTYLSLSGWSGEQMGREVQVWVGVWGTAPERSCLTRKAVGWLPHPLGWTEVYICLLSCVPVAGFRLCSPSASWMKGCAVPQLSVYPHHVPRSPVIHPQPLATQVFWPQASSSGCELKEPHTSSASSRAHVSSMGHTHTAFLPEKPQNWGLIAGWAASLQSPFALSYVAPASQTSSSCPRVGRQAAFPSDSKEHRWRSKGGAVETPPSRLLHLPLLFWPNVGKETHNLNKKVLEFFVVVKNI